MELLPHSKHSDSRVPNYYSRSQFVLSHFMQLRNAPSKGS